MKNASGNSKWYLSNSNLMYKRVNFENSGFYENVFMLFYLFRNIKGDDSFEKEKTFPSKQNNKRKPKLYKINYRAISRIVKKSTKPRLPKLKPNLKIFWIFLFQQKLFVHSFTRMYFMVDCH